MRRPCANRDELTEGYNPTPNFFIRGIIDEKDLSYSDHKLTRYQEDEKKCSNKHFENRLFDRDTLLVLTYESTSSMSSQLCAKPWLWLQLR